MDSIEPFNARVLSMVFHLSDVLSNEKRSFEFKRFYVSNKLYVFFECVCWILKRIASVSSALLIQEFERSLSDLDTCFWFRKIKLHHCELILRALLYRITSCRFYLQCAPKYTHIFLRNEWTKRQTDKVKWTEMTLWLCVSNAKCNARGIEEFNVN